MLDGVAYGVGRGDGAVTGLPRGSGPSDERTESVPNTDIPPARINSPNATETFLAPGIGYTSDGTGAGTGTACPPHGAPVVLLLLHAANDPTAIAVNHRCLRRI
jgi:hypothetical protein